MRLSGKTLLVVVNPFAAPLSADGRATALCPVDPKHPAGRAYIGASTVAKTSKGVFTSLVADGKRLGRDKVAVKYDLRPVSVPDSPHYRRKIEVGEILLAMEAEVAATSRTTLAARAIGGDGAAAKVRATLRSAARRALAAYEQAGGSRAVALAAWREQGLSAVADMIEQRGPFKPGKRPAPTAADDAGTGPDPGIVSAPVLVLSPLGGAS